MARYDAYMPQSPSLSPQKGWIITALTGSLVVHAGLFITLHFQKLENFGLSAPPPQKQEQTMQRVKIIEEKKKKPEELKAVLPDKKPTTKTDIIIPREQMKPEEISVGPQHKPLDTDKVFASEKPVIDMAKLETAPKGNLDEALPKLPDSMFADRTGPKIVAQPMSKPGPDGDGSARAIQVAGQDVEGILNGLSSGTGSARRLSLPGNLTFAYDSADVSLDGRTELEKIAEAFRKFLGEDIRTATFIIEGHSDPTGTVEYNQKLSERRAESVRTWFIGSLGLNPAQVQTVGYGATRPVEGAPTSGTVEEMQAHRRTEIIVRRAKSQ